MVASYIARHGVMRFLGEYHGEAEYPRGQEVIVRSERGLELGEVLCPASPRALQLLTEPTRGQIVRALTEEDRAQAERVRQAELQEFNRCQEFIKQRGMPMELVDVEHLFGG